MLRIEAADVFEEGKELLPSLAPFYVAVETIPCQVVCGKEMTNAIGPGIGGRQAVGVLLSGPIGAAIGA